MENVQQVSCDCCPIDFVSFWERMWDRLSGESWDPKLPLEDLFDCRLRLIEVLGHNFCNRKRKFLKEIGESFPHNVRRMARSEIAFAWRVARLEAGTSLFDLNQWVSCRAEHGGQFSVNCLGVKAFEEEESDDESLIRLFHLAKWRRLNVMWIIILFFTVLCRILPKIISKKWWGIYILPNNSSCIEIVSVLGETDRGRELFYPLHSDKFVVPCCPWSLRGARALRRLIVEHRRYAEAENFCSQYGYWIIFSNIHVCWRHWLSTFYNFSPKARC
jgi:hypothetical protein